MPYRTERMVKIDNSRHKIGALMNGILMMNRGGKFIKIARERRAVSSRLCQQLKNFKNKTMVQDNRRYYLDLKENQRG